MSATHVVVTGPDGVPHPIRPGQRVRFGRAAAADIVIPLGGGLSRLACEIWAVASGAQIVNLSGSHTLEIAVADRLVQLGPKHGVDTSGSYLLPSGVAAAGTRIMHLRGTTVQVEVRTPTALRAGIAPTRPQHLDGEATSTDLLRIDPHTKEFVTALMLCRDRLTDPAGGKPLPTAREIAQRALEAVNCWHLATRFDADLALRARITGQIHEHLRNLRTKASGVLPESTNVTKPLLAEILLDLEILTPAHLELLHDPQWLTAQERLWWKS